MTDQDMKLPEGKTCIDCAHYGRCKALFDCPPGNTQCDWAPSRFRQRVTDSMSSIREQAKKPVRYKRFADMTWPTVDDNLQWKLRYAPESVSREDQFAPRSRTGQPS